MVVSVISILLVVCLQYRLFATSRPHETLKDLSRKHQVA